MRDTITALIVALVAALGALLGVGAQNRKLRAETRSSDAKTDADSDEAARKLREEVSGLWSRVDDLTQKERECRETVEIKSREIASIRMAILRSDIASLKRGDPAALAADIVADIPNDAGLCAVLDEVHSGYGFVISIPDGRGTIVWCNLEFANKLLMTRDRMLELGWMGLVHPGDVLDTKAAEGSAHADETTLRETVNRWRRSDGVYVQWGWRYTTYGERRSTLALAIYEGIAKT